MSIDFSNWARASRVLPQPVNDTDPVMMRANRYGDQLVMPLIRKQHALAEEGVYYGTNNAQTGIATPTGTSYSATVGMISIFNSDTVGNLARRISLDNIVLVTTAAGSFASAGVNSQIMVYTDAGDRYSSGGTDLTANIVNPNQDAPKNSIAKVRFGALTLSAATGAQRALCGLRILRPVVSATVVDVVGETKVLNFGGVEASIGSSITIANANFIPVPLPPVVIGPQQSALIHYVMNGTTPGAVSFAPELWWWER